MSDRLDLIVKVASMYYEENKTQTYISKKLNLSRPTISTLLQEGKDLGIIKISILKKNAGTKDLVNNLKEKYPINNLFIAPENSKDPLHDIGVICADYIEQKRDEKLKIGLGLGNAVYEFSKCANYISTNFDFITPLVGGVDLKNDSLHSNRICFDLSKKYSCDPSFFYAPFQADSIDQKEMLIDSSMVKSSLERAKSVDVAILGVGNPMISSAFQRLYYLKEEDLKIFKEKKVVGDIVTSFFNENFNCVETPSSKKLIGLTIKDLDYIKDVVVVASGEYKKYAIKTLLENHTVNTLIIDYPLAEGLYNLK